MQLASWQLAAAAEPQGRFCMRLPGAGTGAAPPTAVWWQERVLSDSRLLQVRRAGAEPLRASHNALSCT